MLTPSINLSFELEKSFTNGHANVKIHIGNTKKEVERRLSALAAER